MLIEARHTEFADTPQDDDDVILDGEPVNPRLHMAMHQVVANQPDPAAYARRLSGLPGDWPPPQPAL